MFLLPAKRCIFAVASVTSGDAEGDRVCRELRTPADQAGVSETGKGHEGKGTSSEHMQPAQSEAPRVFLQTSAASPGLLRLRRSCLL